MTGPLQIIPDVVRGFAEDQRLSGEGFMTAPAPPAPGNDADDPTASATGEFTDTVHRARTTLKQRSDRHADAMTTSATLLEAQDQHGAQAVSAVSPKDQSAIFTGLLKDVTSTLTGAVQSLSAATFAGVASTAQAGGTLLNTGMSAMQTGAKMTPDRAGAAGVPAVAGFGGVPVARGASTDNDDGRAAATRPAAASGSPAPSAASPASGGAGYVHPQDRDQAEVRQAGFAMPGGSAAGLGAMGGHSEDSVAKASRTARIVTGTEPPPVEDPPTGPIDPRALARAIASI